MTIRSPRNMLILLAVLAVVTVVVTPLIGSSGVALEQVFWTLRAPRLVMAMLAGIALSLSGMTFQAIFRNPLASPFTLGVASGASLAAAIAIRLDVSGFWWAISTKISLAFLGAMITVLIVYAIARLRRGAASTTLLLAGVSIGFICSAAIVMIQYLSHEREISQMVRWMMGSVEIIGTQGWLTMIPVALLVAGGAAICYFQHRELDLLMMGELTAASRGVHVGRARMLAYFGASVMTAAVVAVCGPIMFVGLIVPHLARLLVGPSHRTLAPACALGGVILLPWCDTVSRNMIAWIADSAVQIPVGVLTSIIGGVFFLALLLTRRDQGAIL